MIEAQHPKLSIGAQCLLLSIARSSFYYEPQGESEMNLALPPPGCAIIWAEAGALLTTR